MPSLTTPLSKPSVDQQMLTAMARDVADACPDLREMAHTLAAEILKQHHIENLDPDNVYWDRFADSQSSSLTYDGWRHSGKPIESWTLPQLVMHRFNGRDQDAADNLQVVGGFYTAGPDAGVYDETDEVRLLPQDVMRTLWATNFKSAMNSRITEFWAAHSAHFRTLAKANLISKALENLEQEVFNKEQFTALMTALGIDLGQPVSVSMLQAESPLAQGVRVSPLDIAGYEATDILCILESSGRQFLYMPGEVDALQVFDTPQDLQWWLMIHANHSDNRARFMSHFPLSTHEENERGVGLNHALDLMYSNWGPDAHPVINHGNAPLTIDPFTHLRDASKARMAADADYALHSNGELRKQIWMGYLRAFGKVFGAMAALDWPIALAVVGAGLADVGLNIDQAINGRTTAERKQGAIGAVLGSIDVLFNSVFLLKVPGADIAELPDEIAGVEPPEPEPASEPDTTPTHVEIETETLGPVYPTSQAELLAPFETNELLEVFTPPAREGRLRGVYVSPLGQTYVSIDFAAYQVRHVQELNTWAIIDPENPFSFYRNVPVRLDASGEWQVLSRQGLRGGKWPWQKSTPAQTTAAASPYEIPEQQRESLRSIVESPGPKLFLGYQILTSEEDVLKDFFVLRQKLVTDSGAFYANLELPERPTIPVIESDAPPKVALRQLYEHSSGLVIGESHHGISSKRFLIDNMQVLARQKVKTLYMEHLFTDLHQADLNAFAKTGKMPKNLQNYLKILDEGHQTDPTGTYTFLNVVKSANKYKIRIRAIDCMSSYRVTGLADRSQTLRQQMMNYYAHTVIAADQAANGAGKWIALVGNSHSNTFLGTAGVAELEGAIGLRVQDVKPGEPTGFDIDPGEVFVSRFGTQTSRVKNDLRLRARVAAPKIAASLASPAPNVSVESRLGSAGSFTFERNNHVSQLVHRSADGSIVRTPIKSEGSRFYIERPRWTRINQRRFANLEELASALKLMGMHQV